MLTNPNDNARSAYADAFEFGPRDFEAGEILPPPLLSSNRTQGAGRTHVGLCPKFLVSPPESDSFRKDLCFTHDVYFFSEHEISEMRGPPARNFARWSVLSRIL